MASQLAVWTHLFTGGHGGPAWIRLVTVVLLALALASPVAARIRRWRDRRAHAGDSALVDGGFGEQFPVEIAVVARGQRLGVDRGVVWFADGLMGFSGAASSFVLAAWDVKIRATATPARYGQTPIPAGAIELADSPVPAYLLLEALGTSEAALRERLKRFDKETAAPDAERHWPPLVPYAAGGAPYGNA